MRNLFNKVRKEFKVIKETGKSCSEIAIRRRITIESMRMNTYYRYYLFTQFEMVSVRILITAIIVFNILNLFLNLYSNVFIISIPVLIMLICRMLSGESKNTMRLNREIHKIKKVLDQVDDDQELHIRLIFWYQDSKQFIKDMERMLNP